MQNAKESGFDSSNVARYEEARPGYRAEVVDKVSSIIEDCSISAPKSEHTRLWT